MQSESEAECSSSRSNLGRSECAVLSTRCRNARLHHHSPPSIRGDQIRRICTPTVPLRRLNFLGSFRIQEACSGDLELEGHPRTTVSPSSRVSHLCPLSPLSLSSSLSLAHPWDYKNGSVIFTHPIIEGPSPIYGNRAAWSGGIGPTPGVHHFQKLQNLRRK